MVTLSALRSYNEHCVDHTALPTPFPDPYNSGQCLARRRRRSRRDATPGGSSAAPARLHCD